MTRMICKPLLPVYDKPLIYYPLSILLQAGITDIMVIIPEGEEETFSKLLGDGSAWGAHISYAVQKGAARHCGRIPRCRGLYQGRFGLSGAGRQHLL